MQRLDNEITDLKEKMNTYEVHWLFALITQCLDLTQQNNYFRYKQKIEELRKQMNWDQQELETWLEQTAKKDDDVLTVQKYAQADQNKIKVVQKVVKNLHKIFRLPVGHEFKARTLTRNQGPKEKNIRQ